MEKLIEIVYHLLIEPIQLGSFVVLEFGVRPCSAPVKDQVVAILHLGEKEPVLTAGSFAFAVFEEGRQTG